jgi:ferrous iron transport protein A
LTLLDLKIGEKAVITNESLDLLPIKLVEFGCVPGGNIEVIQFAPFKDPIYIKMNETFVAIRKEIAQVIEVATLIN